jgi:hypothetical protein
MMQQPMMPMMMQQPVIMPMMMQQTNEWASLLLKLSAGAKAASIKYFDYSNMIRLITVYSCWSVF